MQQENPLARLHADIDSRVRATLAQQPQWLCRKGCGGCCRRLAEVPRLTAAEWELLREGLAALSQAQRHTLGRAVAALAERPASPVICPLLDRTANACLVYAQRPVACRTYGFYVQRQLGLYCRDIERLVAEGALADVVWGNHDAIDRQLASLGKTQTLGEWLAARPSQDRTAPDARPSAGPALIVVPAVVGH